MAWFLLFENGLSLSYVTNEDKNAKQRCKPKEVFPRENQDGNSKMSPFRSSRVFTKRSRNDVCEMTLVKLEIKLEESDDECDLVIDVPPQTVIKKPRISKNYTNENTDKELAAVTCAEKLHDSAIADILECTEEKAEKMITSCKNGRGLNKSEKLGNVSLKANEILPDANIDILKVLEKRDALAYTEEKRVSSAASIEADMQKGILKQGNAETNILVEAFLQEHATNEDYVSSGRLTQSVVCTGHSSKDETTIERPYKEIINTKESKSTEENGGNGSPEDTYPYRTYYLNKKENELTLLSSSTEEAEPSGEDTELSESDDPLEECRRIFDEFEREAQKKDGDKQAYGGNVDLSLLETKVNIPGQKRRIAHTAKYDALIEEQSVYDRCGSKNMYLNFAVKTLKKLRDHGGALYELLKDYLLTEEQLDENNFPRPNPEKNGGAILTGVVKNAAYDECAVGVVKYMLLLLQENIDVKKNATIILVEYWNKKCYTTHGLELTRVTVVDAKLQVVYDTFVKPDGKVVDYDIRVVDTSVVFPHRLGLPHKRALRNLMADYLRRIRQDDALVSGILRDAISAAIPGGELDLLSRVMVNLRLFAKFPVGVPAPSSAATCLPSKAKQPQFPQPLLIRLVLQTLHQLRCPSLDTLQHLNVSLVGRGPKLNTAFEAAFQPLFPKPVALHGVAVTQVQDLALGLVKPHTIDLSPSIQPVQVLLQSLPTLKQINTPTQLGVICKLTEGALDPFVQIIDKDVKQDWPQHRALGNTTCDRPPTGVNSIHHHSSGPAIQPVLYPAKSTPVQAMSSQFLQENAVGDRRQIWAKQAQVYVTDTEQVSNPAFRGNRLGWERQDLKGIFVSAGLQGSANPVHPAIHQNSYLELLEKQGTAVGHSQQNRNNDGILQKSKSEPGNHRPVSLTSIPEKVMEQFILETISRHMRDGKVIVSR
ncbi:hypothetical protein QYF61_017949 [Mycteria americana]|uniref:RNA exonuclease 1 homolog-like domain-containing protein n=1 Tax=Mycteria americana TaxID=33587 RepID=A0AAN7RQY3_MYCAM|nr:hypothetical protein QYF61_017949 [Mycteria americana]